MLVEHMLTLTEEPELLINNGGEMNFLLESDHLAALQLLEKTHQVKIALIYIDMFLQSLKQSQRIIKKYAFAVQLRNEVEHGMQHNALEKQTLDILGRTDFKAIKKMRS